MDIDTHDVETLEDRVLEAVIDRLMTGTGAAAELSKDECKTIWKTVLNFVGIDWVSINKCSDYYEAEAEAVRNAVQRKDFQGLVDRYHEIQASLSDETTHDSVGNQLTSNQELALEKAWERQISDNVMQILWKCIKIHYNSIGPMYTNYMAIFQSSGMGKSRVVDELGKHHLVIPINLRHPTSAGYPPADHKVRDFLMADFSRAHVYNRCCLFMEELFKAITEVLASEFANVDGNELAFEFRKKMTDGQSFRGHNAFRTEFYDNVVERAQLRFMTGPTAEDMSPAETVAYDFLPARRCHQLISYLTDERSKSSASRTANLQTIDGPLIILAFDEARTLMEGKYKKIGWSNFTKLRDVLDELAHFPCFALFLSTSGNVSQRKSPQVVHPFLMDSRLDIRPFVALDFDMLAHKVSLSGHWNLERLTSELHMSHLGRPLFGSLYDTEDNAVQADIVTFAATKLLNGDVGTLGNHQVFACLAQRIPLQFSASLVTPALERKQVEDHLRVCLGADAYLEGMVTLSSSEPLLSEAAYYIMSQPAFNAPKALKSLMDAFPIDKRTRGEFLVMLLFTIARDKVVGPPDKHGIPITRIVDVVPFLTEGLFRNMPISHGLLDGFANSKMHFNHYIKVNELGVIHYQYLLFILTRGGGVVFASGQFTIDGINPFLRNGTKLSRDNLGVIIWRSYNEPISQDEPQQAFSNHMDVYSLGILKEGDAAIPLIKIVFALAAETPSIQVTRRLPSSDYNAIICEICCAGISPEIFNAVHDTEESVWSALLRASYD